MSRFLILLTLPALLTGCAVDTGDNVTLQIYGIFTGVPDSEGNCGEHWRDTNGDGLCTEIEGAVLVIDIMEPSGELAQTAVRTTSDSYFGLVTLVLEEDDTGNVETFLWESMHLTAYDSTQETRLADLSGTNVDFTVEQYGGPDGVEILETGHSNCDSYVQVSLR